MSRSSWQIIVAICLVGYTGKPASRSRHPSESALTDAGGRVVIPAPDQASSDAFLTGRPPLSNAPQIVSVVNNGDHCRVTVKNIGTTPLGYSSAGACHIQLVQEIFESGKWTLSRSDGCGLGKQEHLLRPNDSVALYVKFWDTQKRERMLARFWEKGTFRADLVVLAAEPAGFW
ncbi:MAG: hypothetical protein V4719_30680 [Planctomycetota bacterium]